MSKQGFTFVEVLLILSVLAILFLVTIPKIWNVYGKYQLDSSMEDLVQTVRFAQTKAMQGEASSTYSVHLAPGAGGSFTLYRGTTYATRDASLDEVHTLVGSLVLSSTLTDITFSKLEGTTSNTGTITITWPDANKQKVISINSYGVITRQ